MAASLEERFLAKVTIGDHPGDCWEWTATKNSHGYGHIRSDGRMVGAHRISYELSIGPIPNGLDLDHLCGNRSCVNPDHLEPVTRRENVLRGTHSNAVTYRTGICQRGHSMEDALPNTGGRKTCRTCAKQRQEGAL